MDDRVGRVALHHMNCHHLATIFRLDNDEFGTFYVWCESDVKIPKVKIRSHETASHNLNKTESSSRTVSPIISLHFFGYIRASFVKNPQNKKWSHATRSKHKHIKRC
jgi:hypothetical protein